MAKSASNKARKRTVMKNGKIMLDKAMQENGETWDDVEASTMTEEDMNAISNLDYGSHAEGCEFTVWTKQSVYYRLRWAEWVGRVSRNPDGESNTHMFDRPSPESALYRLAHEEPCIIQIGGKEYEATWSAKASRFYLCGMAGKSAHHSEVDSWRPASVKF